MPFFDEIFVIQESISHLVKSQNTLLKNTATNMQTKFEKYWGESDKINLFCMWLWFSIHEKIEIFEVFFLWNLWEFSGESYGW